jgi:hypothetical protein
MPVDVTVVADFLARDYGSRACLRSARTSTPLGLAIECRAGRSAPKRTAFPLQPFALRSHMPGLTMFEFESPYDIKHPARTNAVSIA